MKPQPKSYDPFATLYPQGRPSTLGPAPQRPVTPPATIGGLVRNAPPTVPVAGRAVLELHYPGIAHAITLMWGHPEMNAYFERLWLSDNPQRPLHPEAMSELMLLAQVHQLLCPQRPATLSQSIYGTQYGSNRSSDVWADTRPTRATRRG